MLMKSTSKPYLDEVYDGMTSISQLQRFAAKTKTKDEEKTKNDQFYNRESQL